MLCISLRDQVDAGYRFGQLGLKLLEVYKMEAYLPRVYCAVYGKSFLKIPLCSPVLVPRIHIHLLSFSYTQGILSHGGNPSSYPWNL